jgi:hypothetical protein
MGAGTGGTGDYAGGGGDSEVWQLVTAIWQLNADIYTDGAYSVSTAAELQPPSRNLFLHIPGSP